MLEQQPSAEQTASQVRYVNDVDALHAVFGICISGWVYSILRFAIYIVFSMRGVASSAEILCSILGFIVLSVAGAVALVPITLGCIGLCGIIAYTTLKQPYWPAVLAAAGGLTGFGCTAFTFMQINLVNWPQHIGQVILGPMMATVFGQLGAAALTILPPATTADASDQPSSLRFGILQIMIATAWIAGILTLLKVTNILGPWSASIAAAWLVYQAFTLTIIVQIVREIQSDG